MKMEVAIIESVQYEADNTHLIGHVLRSEVQAHSAAIKPAKTEEKQRANDEARNQLGFCRTCNLTY